MPSHRLKPLPKVNECKDPLVQQHCVRLGITQSEMVDWQLRMQNEILYRALYAPRLDPEQLSSSSGPTKEKRPRTLEVSNGMAHDRDIVCTNGAVTSSSLSEEMEDVEISESVVGCSGDGEGNVEPEGMEDVETTESPVGYTEGAQEDSKNSAVQGSSKVSQTSSAGKATEGQRSIKRRKVGDVTSTGDEICMSDARTGSVSPPS